MIQFLKTIVKVFALMSLFMANSVLADFHITLEGKDKNPRLEELVNQITADLPTSIKEELSDGIRLRIKNLNKKEITQYDDNCSSKITLARVRRFQNEEPVIEIDGVNLREWETENRAINCAHKNNHQYVKATIIHEIFHLYDFQKKFSKNPAFLNIAGFIAKGLIIKKRTNLNQLEARSPDRYEYVNNEESAAVNFEHFLYDSEFKCRRPTHYDYYARNLKVEPHRDSICQTNSKISMSSQTMSGSAIMIKDLDPKRLYEVHYLFAGKGDAIMSRFGHSMFRLVMCAPGRAIGPECLNDQAHHIIISFRANIQDVKMDYSKGITGEYPSQLFFLTLPDVINEYTKGEFREVLSLPLKLTAEEKQRFIQRSSELYWSYKGKYYFFTNNCATEAMNLLRVAMNENKEVQKQNIVTPLGMYDYLVKSKIGNAEVFQNLKLAERKGHYFPAVSEKVASSLKILGMENTTFAEFAEKNNALARRQIYQAAIDLSDDQVMTAANALRVEDLILRSRELQFTKTMGAKLFGNEPDPRLQGTVLGDRIVELQALYAELSAENYVKAGYGIPLEEEFLEIPKTKIDEVSLKIKDYSKDLQEIAAEFFSDEVKELKESMENRIELLKIITNAK